jgi:enoyl-CoA hydratase
MQTDDLTEVRVTIEGHVALVTMDNPPVNAQSRALAEQLTAVMDRISDHDEIRVAVLTGAGLAIAASCDILIASEKASLGLPEVDVGLLGGGKHTMRLFSHSLRRRMLFTGYRVPASELYRLGIVEACTTPEQLLPTAMEMAQLIASKAPLATRMAKHSANTIEEMSLRDGYRYEQDMTAQIAKTEDAREAQLAFAEKRAPVFKGR